MTQQSVLSQTNQNHIVDGDFSDAVNEAWNFERPFEESFSQVVDISGERFYSGSISGYVWQEISVKPDTYYTLTFKTKASRLQSDGRERDPDGYVDIYGDGLELRININHEHTEWHLHTVRFKTQTGTGKLKLTAFASSGTLSFDDFLIAEQNEQIDPDNLIKNPKFNNNEEFWKIREQSPEAHGKVIEENGNKIFSSINFASARQDVVAKHNKTYIFNIRMRSSASGAFTGRVQIMSPFGVSEELLIDSTEWKDYSVEFTIPNNVGAENLQIRLYGGSDIYAYFDDLSLKEKL
ncbi:carbohydrate binding domain-containing protein [Enterobacter cloacae]|uniref:carbohydrate binding domain-containing protein n=1 Tax=Enterobacter cloacae TaxID=550 RepID=UPI0020043C37|nr:carbohydrate binding domain-containing protein [Enterobacter cloacae]MCK7319913.1 carbohydrate binding domain-containing protein [Enterobacter cloacae]